MANHPQILGRVEIARLLFVEKRTPSAWFNRGLLPEPEYDSINGSPAWDRQTIIRWAVETGRLPEHLADEAAPYGPVAQVRGGRKSR